MKTLKRMGKPECELITSEVFKVLSPIAEKLGCDFKRGRGTYDPTLGEFSLKITFTLKELADGTKPGKVAWDRVCALYDLTPEHFETTFTVRGDRFRAIELNTRRPKWPLVVENVKTGKRSLFGEDTIKRMSKGLLFDQTPRIVTPPRDVSHIEQRDFEPENYGKGK